MFNNRAQSQTLILLSHAEIPRLDVQRGSSTRFDQTRPVGYRFQFDLESIGIPAKRSVLVLHPMLSVQSSKKNATSRVELWRNGTINGELPMVSPQVTSVYPFPWELSPQVASGHSFPLELSSRSHILGFPS